MITHTNKQIKIVQTCSKHNRTAVSNISSSCSCYSISSISAGVCMCICMRVHICVYACIYVCICDYDQINTTSFTHVISSSISYTSVKRKTSF